MRLVVVASAKRIHYEDVSGITLCGRKEKIRPVTHQECVKLLLCEKCIREKDYRTGKIEPRRYG